MADLTCRLADGKLRAFLSALGIAIGVAAIVAVLGLSSSSESGLLAGDKRPRDEPAHVTNGQTLFGGTAELPIVAPAMIGRIGPVYAVQYTGSLSNANVYRSPLIPSIDTNALSVDDGEPCLALCGQDQARRGQLSECRHRHPAGLASSAWCSLPSASASTPSTKASASGSTTRGSTFRRGY